MSYLRGVNLLEASYLLEVSPLIGPKVVHTNKRETVIYVFICICILAGSQTPDLAVKEIKRIRYPISGIRLHRGVTVSDIVRPTMLRPWPGNRPAYTYIHTYRHTCRSNSGGRSSRRMSNRVGFRVIEARQILSAPLEACQIFWGSVNLLEACQIFWGSVSILEACQIF